MPIHDWTRVQAGDFHHFHQGWIVNLTNALNRGILPPPFIAMAEQVTGRPIPDGVTLEMNDEADECGGLAVAAAPPTARLIAKRERINYAKRADRVAIRHGRGRVVAIIEIVSPGNKQSAHAMRSFFEKAVDIIDQGIHLLLVDLFPPTPRDPSGMHKAIWDVYEDVPFESPEGKTLSVAAYQSDEDPTAYVESVGIGDPLPSSPVFLSRTHYVRAPLEQTYEQTWSDFPAVLKRLLEYAA